MKYPRTKHLPWSPGRSREDLTLDHCAPFLHLPMVITEKVDGSNICMTSEDLFARSHSGKPIHPSFDLAKAKHAEIKRLIAPSINVFAEYTYAVHSIEYTEMPSYFWIIGVREERNYAWYGWEKTDDIARLLGIPTVPIIDCRTFFDNKSLQLATEFWAKQSSALGGEREGVCIRPARRMNKFCVGKYVRKNHVQTDEHWSKSWRKQELKILDK